MTEQETRERAARIGYELRKIGDASYELCREGRAHIAGGSLGAMHAALAMLERQQARVPLIKVGTKE
jgi:hypothetical protein